MCLSKLISQEPARGSWARNLRISFKLTQKELACLARVTSKEVKLLEHNKPLSSDAERRILQELCAIRVHS